MSRQLILICSGIWLHMSRGRGINVMCLIRSSNNAVNLWVYGPKTYFLFISCSDIMELFCQQNATFNYNSGVQRPLSAGTHMVLPVLAFSDIRDVFKLQSTWTFWLWDLIWLLPLAFLSYVNTQLNHCCPVKPPAGCLLHVAKLLVMICT